MNRPSLEKFAPMVKPKGVVLINSSLIPIKSGRSDVDELIVPANDIAKKLGNIRSDVDELIVPANDIAKKLGNIRSANIVALSAFVARSKIVDFDILRECVKKEFSKKEKLIPLNMEAVTAGGEAGL